MDSFFDIGNIIVGAIVSLIGFKIYNPWKSSNDPEKEEEWYAKWGVLFKVGGILVLLLGIFRILM